MRGGHMMKTLTGWVAGAALAVGILGATTVPGRAQTINLTIGTGAAGGVYIALGSAICQAAEKEIPHLRCKAVKTKGSIDNLIGLKKGLFDIGIVQSDIQYQAVHGTGVFAKIGALPGMRAMFSAHAEALAILARPGSGIQTLDDLAGKRINIGTVTSGTNATMRLLFGAKGWTAGSFAQVLNLPVTSQYHDLCTGKIDATAYLVGHPNAVVNKMLRMCDAHLVDVSGPEVDRLIAANPYSIHALIPMDDYDRVPKDVPTFGILATVMTTERADANLIYQVTRAVFENLGMIRRQHPSFHRLQPWEMARRGITAPYHPGAVRYLRQVGRLP